MRYRILVVDEEESPNALILSALEQSGLEFKIEKSFRAAVTLLQTFTPHTVVAVFSNADIDIPGLIKEFRAHASVPIIVACSSDVCAEAERTMGNEAEDFIELPCRPERTLRIIHGVIKRKELELQSAECRRLLENSNTRISAIEKSLQRAEKMTALGSLTAGLAHEINTPMGSIKGNNDILALAFEKVQDLLKQYAPAELSEKGGELYDIVPMIEDAVHNNRLACEHILTIVKEVRNFALERSEDRQKLDIHEVIETTLILTAHEFKPRIRIHKELAHIPAIEGFPHRLSQVFMNLLVNAAQAIEGDGEIRIRTCQKRDMAHVIISDTGIGMSPIQQARIFESGFTTKSDGTGLGLFICRRIIEDHGGRIELISEMGKGTTFTVMLPIKSAKEKGKNV